MKKRLSVFLSLILCAALLVACGNQATPSNGSSANNSANNTAADTNDDDKILIGMAFATLQEERYNKERGFMEAKAAELGVDVVFQDAQNNAANQISQVENLINQGVDIIVINCVDEQTGKNAAAICKNAGVPIIAYSRVLQCADVTINLGYDGVWVGEQQAKAAVAAVPKGNYAIIAGDPMEPEGLKMYKGIWNVLQPEVDAGNIDVVFDQFSAGWLAENAMANAENALTQNNNDIDAIIVLNDNMAGGVAQAVKAQGLDGQIYMTGGDCDLAGCQRIAEGTQGMTIYWNNKILAETAVQGAVNCVKGDDSMITTSTKLETGEEIPMIGCNVDVVDANNLVEIVIDGGVYPVEDVYVNVPESEWPK